jgi:beta-glucosidase/6-phospho-beta-glucosidase/beta-galactosidase
MSWEDAYATMNEIETNIIKEERERKFYNASMEEQFQLLYPTIPWDRLQKSSVKSIADNDKHYMDVNTKQIYSWNYYSKRWECCPEEHQRSTRLTFFKIDLDLQEKCTK